MAATITSDVILIVLSTYFLCTTSPIYAVDEIQCPCRLDEDHRYICQDAGCTEIPTNLDPTVEEINLGGNNIEAVPILPYPNLKLLILSRNSITNISNEVFTNLEHLVTLNLDGNRIRKLQPQQFQGLKLLKHLYLQNNVISRIDSNVFTADLSNVLSLDLSNNSLWILSPEAWVNLQSLHLFYLESNELKSLGVNQFKGLRNLRRLELNRNEIEDIKAGAFQGCTSLQYLDLSYNNLNKITPSVFTDELKSLRFLILGYNKIQTIEKNSLQELFALEDLHLDYTQLSDLQPGIFPLQIKKLFLTGLDYLTAIKAETFKDLHMLQTLHANKNRLLATVDPDSFGGMGSTLMTLDLSDNDLTTLSQTLVDWSKLDYLDLSGNPWKCDCNVAWMKVAITDKEVKQRARCASPGKVAGQSMDTLDISQMTCSVDSGQKSLAIGLSVGFTVLILVIWIGLTIKYRKRIFPSCYNKRPSKYSMMHNTSDDVTHTVNS